MLQMQHDALATLSHGAENVIDLAVERAAQNGVYLPGDLRRPKKPPRLVDADCVFCHERSVLDFEDGYSYLCRNCEKPQPVEVDVHCVYCKLPSAIKRIDRCTCVICDRDQPTESNVIPFQGS